MCGGKAEDDFARNRRGYPSDSAFKDLASRQAIDLSTRAAVPNHAMSPKALEGLVDRTLWDTKPRSQLPNRRFGQSNSDQLHQDKQIQFREGLGSPIVVHLACCNAHVQNIRTD